MKKILVTGAFGQIGSELVPALEAKYGRGTVVAMDIAVPEGYEGEAEKFDIRDKRRLEECMEKHDVGTVYHLVSLLSARGEKDPSLAWEVNMEGLRMVLDLGVKYGQKVFWPSSIAAFGPTTPRVMTPQTTVLEPTTMYGVTKVAGELLCRYYYIKHGLCVRTIRYPGIISWKQAPGGGTTDYAVAIFYEGITRGKYECFVEEKTRLPMVYMDDAVEGTIRLMEAEVKGYKAYNMGGMSFSAGELVAEVKKHLDIEVTYRPDFRQKIADSWPESVDDREARRDWGWEPKYGLKEMTREMVMRLKDKLGRAG